MANNVFANGREISCKKASGKSICAFPDVCMTPPDKVPPTPPGVPVPYPNTGMAGDSTSGSKKVKITGKEISLKNKSYFKKSMGDEAGCATKKGVLTSKNRGKVYFSAWSMDVKIEGENVVRHMDLTTHNHGSFPGNSPTWPFLDSAAFSGTGPCAAVAKSVNDNCAGKAVTDDKGNATAETRQASMEAMCKDKKCKGALKCVLSPKSPSNCCPQPQPKPPKKTPHHIVPASQFHAEGDKDLSVLGSVDGHYDYDAAPCICASGTTHSGKSMHAKIHTETNNVTVNHPSVIGSVSKSGKSIKPDAEWSVGEAESVGAKAVARKTKCPEACVKSQVRRGHKEMDIKREDRIRPTTAGEVSMPPKNGKPMYS